MSAVNPCIVGQQFANGLQAMDDIIIRPEFEVSAANTHVKEGVARECQLLLLAIKEYRPWSMSRCRYNLKGMLTEYYLFVVVTQT